MMRYRYLAATLSDQRHSGWITAPTPENAIEELRRQGLIIVRLDRPSVWSQVWETLNKDLELRAPVSRQDLADLSQEWAGLVNAGVTIDESLEFLMAGRRASVQKVLAKVREDLKGGASLHEALSQHPACFPEAYRALIQAGEAAGNLGATLQRLSDDLTTQRGIIEEIRNALLYPAFLLVTAVVGITTLLVVVVPNLESLLGARSRDSLPLATRTVIQISHVLREHGVSLALIVALIVIAAVASTRSKAGKARFDRVFLKTPVIGSLLQTIETARVTRVLGALLSGGVTLARAMPLAVKTVSNTAIRDALETAHDRVMTGSPVGEALAASATLPGDVIGLIRMGERTGRLDAALERAALLYEGRATRRLKTLTTVLTPVLTIGFGLIAGVIIYAMLSTILSINDLAGS